MQVTAYQELGDRWRWLIEDAKLIRTLLVILRVRYPTGPGMNDQVLFRFQRPAVSKLSMVVCRPRIEQHPN